CGAVDCVGEECHDIRKVARSEDTAVFQYIASSRLAGNLMDCLREGKPAFLTGIRAQQERECTVQARVWPPLYVEAVADDGCERMLQGGAQILRALIEAEHSCIAFFF